MNINFVDFWLQMELDELGNYFKILNYFKIFWPIIPWIVTLLRNLCVKVVNVVSLETDIAAPVSMNSPVQYFQNSIFRWRR